MGTKTKILGIFAHADDEAVCGWPMMQEDADRHLLTICDHDERRGTALKRVCSERGIQKVYHSNHFEPRFSLNRKINDRERITQMIACAIREINPDVIATHNAWGEYGHPDHIFLNQMIRGCSKKPVIVSSLKYGSQVWLAPKAANEESPRRAYTVQRDEAFWNRCKDAYGDLWTTNQYINNGQGEAAVVHTTDPLEGSFELIDRMIVWLCDQYGWAFHNQAAKLASVMTQYAHRVVYLRVDRDAGSYYYAKQDIPDIERADVIVAMTPAAMQFMPQRDNVVSRLSGVRST